MGHSWGGDTGAQIAEALGKEGRHIDLLVTLDPVGSRGNSGQFLGNVIQGTGQWYNVNATGGGLFNGSNLVAGIGGPYNRNPERFADRHFDAVVPHDDVRGMLNSTVPGAVTTLRDALLGRAKR